MKARELPQGYRQRMDNAVCVIFPAASRIWHIAQEFIVEREKREVVVNDDEISIVIRESTEEEKKGYLRMTGNGYDRGKTNFWTEAYA